MLPDLPRLARPASDTNTPNTLMQALRHRVRFRHYSLRTERAYVHWVRRFIVFNGRRHPREMGAPEVTAFLGSLATEGRVSAATQNQALAAVLFLYKEVLEIELPWLDSVPRAKRGHHIPTVLTRDETLWPAGRVYAVETDNATVGGHVTAHAIRAKQDTFNANCL